MFFFYFKLKDSSRNEKDSFEQINKFILYFHSHGSCRHEGRFLLNYASKRNSNLILIDMRGSGDSQGQFTTLGIKESLDICNLLKDLQKKFICKTVLLYGRSMGAASLMKFVVENKKGIINKIKNYQKLKELF